MSVKERLKEFAKCKERSVRQFEYNCGLTLGYINAIRQSIQPDKIMSIASRYPDLNTAWLMTGEGEMLIENRGVSQKADEKNADLRKIIALLEEKADRLENENSSLKNKIESLEKELLAAQVTSTTNVE